MRMRAETHVKWTPFLLTANINTAYKQINSFSLLYITFEDTVMVFKQSYLLKNLQIKLQKGLSCHFLLTANLTETQEDHADNPHAKNEDPSTIPYHWDTEWNMVPLVAYKQLNTRSKRFYSELQTLKQMERIKLKLANRLWIFSLLLKRNVHL